MKWVLFTGTWRLTSNQVEEDVRQTVRDVLSRGDGVLTGGATGVDYFAIDEAVKLNPTATHIRVIIPADLENYIQDYKTNWCIKPITKETVSSLALLLNTIKKVNPSSLLEMPYKKITQHEYNLRNKQEIIYAHEVYAFQVNNSTGTQHTIDEARKAGLLISIHKKYSIVE